MLEVRQHDLEKIEKILASNIFDTPTIKISIYKNRRGRYKGMYLWCKSDLSTCRITPMFATSWNYEIIELNDLKIKVEEEGAFCAE